MGIDTRIFSTDTFPVPNTWVFEKFLNLSERLTGQSVSIKSIFNKEDSNPSMVIYLHENNKYKFKDFSTGHHGDAVDLIQLIYNLPNRQEAFRKTYDFWKEGDYESYNTEEVIPTKKEVISHTVRQWNTNDVKYWTQYFIGSDLLNLHQVKPLETYTFQITRGSNVEQKVFSNPFCYGYFRDNGMLYKIYNPKATRTKFIKIKNYIQGHDQLTYKSNWLLILASLKDLMAFKTLNIKNIECIAPDSENTMITEKQMAYYKKRYKYISILFDNDLAGKKSAKKYQSLYKIPSIDFEVEKDIADCIKEHGIKNTIIFIKPHLIKLKNEFTGKAR